MKRPIKLVVAIIALFCIIGTVFVGVGAAAKKDPLQEVWNAIFGLQNRMNSVETTLDQAKTIRFYTPDETTNDQLGWKDAAVFVWAPQNTTDNAIMDANCYFKYLVQPPGYQISFRVLVNEVPAIQNSIVDFDQTEYEYSVVWRLAWDVLKPDQNAYTIKFQIQYGGPAYGLQYVKDINIILHTIDGLPPS